ncbi:hypothetical protein AB0E08_08020 [Streptomyces sp. NPDC048281]|uniref:hypothetical protein n=1 Tax=Streptomyces sp. NPDC048281 TaxID=3154715 RepID=UPI003443361D
MPEPIFAADTIVPTDGEPTCCPDAYLCLTADVPEIECPRHGGFEVCCDKPDLHVPQDPRVWHEQMYRYEQDLLNRHIQRVKALQEHGLDDDPVMLKTLSILI